uniref:apocytochrome b n=1 Tax=Pseudoceramium tenerrimum TaxID=196911 RepID=UPI002E796371|nr:apocytochrome b [Pseudoceramium tenerrimum]YP_011017831.1 apocytochrome b [Pseudoceramium tenerrimum]WQF69706.1 apocytochrome b [Pseudoceramium tenerrimum]WQF69707.1 apocytochrome b [Pseudoceramium tenerrimum]WQF69742.1 apocytochrome b [Pseudoceramium tenerrimum]WQF69743.1 apocytochrome b [Pseudoceramium tenerrimum]
MRLIKYPVLDLVNDHLISYPTPINIHYAWNFGFLSAICLIVQILTGIFLAMHYTPHVELAFASVEHIMRDVNYGWLLRYIHANGASMFFVIVYVHVFRGVYFGSYVKPKQWVWVVGVLILLLMIITAFIGYVLPWGQMSLWGATVITNLVSAVPLIGNSIVTWLWGGFSVDNATLNRFFSLHYLLPFVIAAASLLHITLLHQDGSNNPLGIETSIDKINMFPYFIVKDLLGLTLFLIFFCIFVYFFPNVLGHSDNYIEANPMVTPAHIVPEWYFLPFYAILRSIPHKLGGVIAMLASILILATLPWIHSTEIRSSRFRPIYKLFYGLLLSCCLLLGWIGGMPVEDPYILIGQILSIFYFLFFLYHF